MKSLDDTKKGLECCLQQDLADCANCPYVTTNCKAKNADALAYIQQLEMLAKPNNQIRWERDIAIFAVEHRASKSNWKNSTTRKYYLKYDHSTQDIVVDFCHYLQFFGAIYFEDANMANLAIETFHDELIWYFAEYKDSL